MKIILRYAGKDATEEFDPVHPPDTLDKYLDKSKHLGPVDMSTVEVEHKEETPEEAERKQAVELRPSLEQMYNLLDFEAVARRVMKKTAWAYYSSAADDEIVGVTSFFHPPSPRGYIYDWSREMDCTTGHVGTPALTGSTDYAREPCRLPEDMVPAQGPSRRREGRFQHHHARHARLNALLRHGHRARQAWPPRG